MTELDLEELKLRHELLKERPMSWYEKLEVVVGLVSCAVGLGLVLLFLDKLLS